MKKRYVVLIAVIILILVAVLSAIGYKIIIEKGKEYEISKVEEYNYFVIRQNDLYGVINKTGDIIINPEYDKVVIPNPEKPLFICSKGEEAQAFNENKEQILAEYNNLEPIRFKNISTDLMYEKSVLKYQKDGKYGLIDFQGKEITKAIYDNIESLQYKEGELLVKQNDKLGVINIKGNELVKTEYDEILIDDYYTEDENYKYSGYIVGIHTEEGYRYGYLNTKGKEILKTEYNKISRVTDKDDKDNVYLICAKNGQYGVTKNKETIINNEYQSIAYDENNDVFVLEKSSKYGIANIEGKEIIPVQYSKIDITGIYLYAQNEQGITVYNKNGNQVNIDSDVAILNTENEKYRIRINNKQGTKYGVINEDGKQLIEEKYNYIKYLYDEYFIASYEDGKLGILDAKGNTKIELNNDSLQLIQGTELIQTLKNDTTVIYSETLEKICEMKNATVEEKENYIKVFSDTETKYFDKQGKELQNTDVYPNNKLLLKVEENLYGFVDHSGKTVVECKYDKAYELNEYGFAAVKKDGKWGVINENGEEILPPTYTFDSQGEPSFIGQYYKVVYGFGEIYYTDAK